MKAKNGTVIQAVIILFVIIGLSTFLSPCSGNEVMKCNHSVDVVKLLFATVIFVKGLELFVKEPVTIFFDVFTIVLYIDSILIPAWLIGGCQMVDMACQSVAFPTVYVTTILLISINVISILLKLLKRKGNIEL